MSPFLGGTFNTIMATSFTTHFVDHQIDDLLAFDCAENNTIWETLWHATVESRPQKTI